MIIGDITYYGFSKRRLVRMPDFDSGLPEPGHAPYPDYLSIWRATNGPGFCAVAGAKVANAALRRELTLAEFCARYSDIDATTIAAIKAQDAEARP